MDIANLPIETALEPDEQARQPEVDKGCHGVTFADTTTYIPQDNSTYREVLSQPPKGITHKQKLIWLQQRRTEGLWAQCDDCDRWRYLPRALDRHQLPAKWYCWMNPDKSLATCSAPEVAICLYDEDDLIHAEYAAGSLVLARMPGFPWWPAMVCDCPDTEQYYWLDGFSDIPTHYNVVFFDAVEVSRAWMTPEQLMPYKDNTKLLNKSIKNKSYSKRLNASILQANDADNLSLSARLAKYSFIARFKGSIVTPKKLKKQELRYRNILKRKFNVDFSDGSSSEEEILKTEKNKPKNRIKKNIRVTAVTNNNKINNPKSTEIAAENLNSTKDFNSMAVQIDTNSGLTKSTISEVSNNTSDKVQDTSTVSYLLPSESLKTQDTVAFTLNEDPAENSDDFDF